MKKHHEYGVQVAWTDEDLNPQEKLYVYSQLGNHWLGAYDYRFDKYLTKDVEVYGMRDGETYKLDEGIEINGTNIVTELTGAVSGTPGIEQEFIDINMNTNGVKPYKVEFYDEQMNLLCALEQSVQGPYYLKKYDGYRQFIPRKFAINEIDRKRVQGRLLIYRIIHNLAEEDFRVKSVVVQFKNIK